MLLRATCWIGHGIVELFNGDFNRYPCVALDTFCEVHPPYHHPCVFFLYMNLDHKPKSIIHNLVDIKPRAITNSNDTGLLKYCIPITAFNIFMGEVLCKICF